MGNAPSGVVCGEGCMDEGGGMNCCDVGERDGRWLLQSKSVDEDVTFSDPNQGSQVGDLVSLVRARKQEELHTYLELEPSSVHCTDANGRTALHYAVLCKNYKAAEALVIAGVDVDTRGDDGKTASALAAEIPDSHMLKLLVGLRKSHQREIHSHSAPGTPSGLPRRAPTPGKETSISPHLSGRSEVAYTQFYNKMDAKNRKVFVDSYEQNQNAERVNAITPETRVHVMKLQAENNAKITAQRTSNLRNSWTDPNTHSYMLVKSGAASKTPKEYINRRTPWGGYAQLDQKTNDIIGAMSVQTSADRAIHTLQAANQLGVAERPHQVLRDKVGLSENYKARDPKNIIPYNRRKGWSSKGLPTPPGMHKPETEFTTGARRFE